jgi:putative isomerase
MFRRVAVALTAIGIFCFLVYRSAEAGGDAKRDASALESFVGQPDFAKLTPRLESLNHDIATKGLHDFPEADGKMLTGYAYGEFFDWDLYFENVYLSYYGVSNYDFTNFKVFLDRQQPDGFVSRTIGIKFPRPRQMFKPFLAQLALLGSKQNGDNYEWLRARYYESLKKYPDRWFAYDTDGNGLPVWNSSDASGMDNQISRSGQPDSNFDEGVDLACYLYRELEAMQIIAEKLGKPDDAKTFAKHAQELATAINKTFWDEKDGFYYDRSQKTGQTIRVKSVAGFLPIWAGVASRAQATRLVRDHLTNPREFWLKYPVASYAMTEPNFFEGTRGGCNWRGPAWIPTNYMIMHGLMDYGFKTEARGLALKTFEMALDQNPVTREYYDSDTGKGNGMNPFWGWSSLAYVMPLDFLEHYSPMDLHGTIRPLLKQDLGLSFAELK